MVAIDGMFGVGGFGGGLPVAKRILAFHVCDTTFWLGGESAVKKEDHWERGAK